MQTTNCNIARINLFDTSVSTDNLGDKIIVDSIIGEMKTQWLDKYVTSVTSHDSIGAVGRSLVKQADISLLLGTNALTSKNRIAKKDMWRVSYKDAISLKNKLVLCGVGWRNYQSKVKFIQRQFYRWALSDNVIHSVRDEHSKQMLNNIGIENVVNTSCPTTWMLDQAHCRQIPISKSDAVVFTVTRHKTSPNDRVWINLLLTSYDNIYFWPQQLGDVEYLQSTIGSEGLKRINIIGQSVWAFDELLQTTDIDYIGTRLHGGVQALRHKRRSIILAIDNRAKEIGKDINLPVVDREDTEKLSSFIQDNWPTRINLPVENIVLWKSQFQNKQ